MAKLKIMENLGKIVGGIIALFFLFAFILWKAGQPVLFNTTMQFIVLALAGAVIFWILRSYFKGSPVSVKQIIFAVLLMGGIFYVVQYQLGIDVLRQGLNGIQSIYVGLQSFLPLP